jgi:predicted enzyme related to lactoylglutathione lyase
MTTKNKSTYGRYCWTELSTTDVTKVKEFYGKVFNWSTEDHPMGKGSVYTMWKQGKTEIGGAYALTKEMRSQGIPAHWDTYFLVESVDKWTEKAKKLGATILKEPADVTNVGRMSVVEDPTGGVFCLWQSKNHGEIPWQDRQKNGTVGWTELTTNDTKTAKTFYTKLFGWKAKVETIQGIKYTSFLLGETPIAGMLDLPKEAGDSPSRWMVYFTVQNVTKSVKTASEWGATVLVPPREVPEVGKFSVVEDPTKAPFALIEWAK